MLLTILENRNASSLIIDTYSSTAFYYALLTSQLARLLKIPYFPILHGGNLEWRLKYHPKLSHIIFSNAKMLIAPSGFMIDLFQRYGYQNITLIHNNIDLKIYPFKLREVLKPRILWVRSFAGLYNPQLAIKAVEKLKINFSDIELCFVGPEKDGTMSKCKSMVEKLGLTDNVKFKGKLLKEEWIKLSADYDIFLSTTNIDNTPVSVMEAMALGMVVVSTNAGGVPYLIDDEKTGYLYGTGDEQALVNILKGLISGELQSTSIKAREQAEEWDWADTRWTVTLTLAAS
jgi:glycosyltransferase involved in cell wall biosynthesis